ncbi:MAG: diguanylate cyclase, partial [Ferruginibacter sp.]|nr:diguanylate cyclase [Rhodoferax sp.]
MPAPLAVVSARTDIPAEHFRSVVECSDDAIICKTLGGLITSWNPGAQAIFGYTADEMLGQSMLRLIPPENHNEEGFILEKIQVGEKVDHFETVRLHKHGRRVHVSVTISPIHDRQGRIVGASKIARDITAQKAVETQLKLTACVFTHTNEGILITDRASLIQEVNHAFTAITGYGRGDVLGKLPSMFRSSRQGQEVYKAMWVALIRLGQWKGEIWSRKQNGEVYSTLLSVSRVRGPTGKVQHHVALFSDITPLRLEQEKLAHWAHFDRLTDLPNRWLLSDRLHQARAICLRNKHVLGVLYLDLDGFKVINDRYGHAVGDELLIAISQRARGALRDMDTLARMGGDEFVVVLANLHGADDCIRLTERILAACSEPVDIQGWTLSITASIGITMYPYDDSEPDILMRHADQAMYEAKQSGKNRYHVFDAAQEAALKSRSAQQERIAYAIANDELVLHYQPKVH